MSSADAPRPWTSRIAAFAFSSGRPAVRIGWLAWGSRSVLFVDRVGFIGFPGLRSMTLQKPRMYIRGSGARSSLGELYSLGNCASALGAGSYGNASQPRQRKIGDVSGEMFDIWTVAQLRVPA